MQGWVSMAGRPTMAITRPTARARGLPAGDTPLYSWRTATTSSPCGICREGTTTMGIDILGYATVDCTDLLSNLSPGVAGGHGIHADGATTPRMGSNTDGPAVGNSLHSVELPWQAANFRYRFEARPLMDTHSRQLDHRETSSRSRCRPSDHGVAQIEDDA